MPEAGRMASLSSPGSDSLRGLSFFFLSQLFCFCAPSTRGQACGACAQRWTRGRACARVPEVEERRSAAALEASGS